MDRKPPMVPDTASMIRDYIERGVSRREIAAKMGHDQLTDRMIGHYIAGVQPLGFRLLQLVASWCKDFGKTMADVPQQELIRGHRKPREAGDVSPKVQNLPHWPPVNATRTPNSAHQRSAASRARKQRG